MFQDNKNNDDEFQFSDSDDYEMDSDDASTRALGADDAAMATSQSVIFSLLQSKGISMISKMLRMWELAQTLLSKSNLLF